MKKRFRDTITGRYRDQATAAADPDHTVAETPTPTETERIRKGLPAMVEALAGSGVNVDVEAVVAALHAYEQAQR